MGIDLEAIRRKMDELQKGRRNSNVQLWKPKEAGEYVVRGLPWPDQYTQDGQPFVEKHFYYIGDSFGLLAPYQYGKPDPIHEFINELYRSGTPDDRAIAKKLRPKMTVYLPIIVKKGKDADPGKVVVWAINKFLYQKMLAWFVDEEIGNYLDVEQGFDIKVTFTDAGKRFKGKPMLNSDVELARKPSRLAASAEETKKLLDSIPNINDMYQLKSPQELESILKSWMDGGAGGSDESDNNQDRGSSKGDALDELVNDVKGAAPAQSEAPKETEEKVAAAKAPAKAKKSKKEDDEEPEVKKQTLDEAFDELMADE